MLTNQSQTLKSFILFTIMVLSLYASASYSMDCIGGHWVDGPKCSEMGLNTHAGVCQPGDIYETLCDDRRGSHGQPQNIVCQGTRRCYDYDDHYNPNDYSCYEWDYISDRPCRPGYENADCYGGCERRRY